MLKIKSAPATSSYTPSSSYLNEIQISKALPPKNNLTQTLSRRIPKLLVKKSNLYSCGKLHPEYDENAVRTELESH